MQEGQQAPGNLPSPLLCTHPKASISIILDLAPSPYSLLTLSSTIPRDIHRACKTLTPPDEFASMAVDARQELDLRIGASFTRYQTLRLRQKFQGNRWHAFS